MTRYEPDVELLRALNARCALYVPYTSRCLGCVFRYTVVTAYETTCPGRIEQVACLKHLPEELKAAAALLASVGE